MAVMAYKRFEAVHGFSCKSYYKSKKTVEDNVVVLFLNLNFAFNVYLELNFKLLKHLLGLKVIMAVAVQSNNLNNLVSETTNT